MGVVAPSSGVRNERFERGLAAIRSKGYGVVLGDHVYDRQGYLAGTDEARGSDLTAMFARDDVAAVICARGGYGASRMLDWVDWDIVRRHPKVFVGYSDITTLHLAMERRAGLATFYGPMVTTLGGGLDTWSDRLFWGTISTASSPGDVVGNRDGVTALRQGRAEGPLAGGCLSILCAALGTPEMPDLAGRIVLLEDTDEPLYRVDRLLTQLVRSGCLDDAAGLAIGTVTNLEGCSREDRMDLDTLLRDLLGPLGKPAITGLRFGHADNPSMLPLGRLARLDTNQLALEVRESAVT